MRRTILGYLLVFILQLISTPANGQDQPTYFHDLWGLEDTSGTTHLFYRLYNQYSQNCSYFDVSRSIDDLYENHIYRFNTAISENTLFIQNEYRFNVSCGTVSSEMIDIEFLNHDPSTYFTFGTSTLLDASAGLTSSDGEGIQLGFPGNNHLEIDRTDSMLVVGYGMDFQANSVQLPFDSDQWDDIMYDLSDEEFETYTLDQSIFYIDNRTDDYYVSRSDTLFVTDRSADSLAIAAIGPQWNQMEELGTDPDTLHFYTKKRSNYRLGTNSLIRLTKTSTGFTADTLISAFALNYTTDASAIGHLYVSDSLHVRFSHDHGHSFSPFMTFDAVVTGLYKKPNSNILYVLTKDELLKVDVPTKSSTSIRKVPVSIESTSSEIPSRTKLHHNYPNPFNPSTWIGYSLEEAGHVKIRVYDDLGRIVQTLVDEFMDSGTYKVRFNTSNLASGVYFYQMIYKDEIYTRRMTIIK